MRLVCTNTHSVSFCRAKFPTITRSSSHDSIMDALSGSPKTEDTPESKLEKEVEHQQN